MALGDRLNALLDARGITVAELSRLSGVSAQSIYSIIRRNSTKVELDSLQRIADTLSVTLDYFANDQLFDVHDHHDQIPAPWHAPLTSAYEAAGVPRREAACDVLRIPYVDPVKLSLQNSDTPSNIISMEEYKARMILKLVFNDPAAAGVPLSAESDYEHIEFPEEEVPYNADFGIRISGRSMEPDIRDGDIVWVHKQTSVHDGEVGVFMIDGDAVCKRARVDSYCSLERLESDNKEFPDIICADLGDDVLFRIVGRVVGTCRAE